MILPYLPGAIGWVYLFTLDTESASLTAVNIYYLMNYLSYGGPMLGYFGVAILYLRAYFLGNSSGLYVANELEYWLTFTSGLTYQAIALMVNIIALPGIKYWYN